MTERAAVAEDAPVAQPLWRSWARYQVPYAAKAYAYFPITLTKRVLLHPRRARHDLLVRRLWDRWGWLPAGLGRRNGHPAPLWVHMNSGGEVVMAQALLRRLDAAGVPTCCSSDSVDAQALLRRWYGADRVFFPPWDTTLPVVRTVSRLRPRALVFVLNAYFPRLLAHARRAGVPAVLVNAVLSRNVHVANASMRRALALGAARHLAAVAVQSEEDGRAFEGLGVPRERIAVTGRLEGDLAPLRLAPAEREALRRELGYAADDRVLIAGSTYPEEALILLDALRHLRARLPAARLLLAPRWLRDVSAMSEAARRQGWRVATRTGAAGRPQDVLILDTFGELRTVYGVGDAAFIGSSLVPINERRGGHNVLEPLAHGVPALFGPHMNLWRGPTQALLAAWPGAAVDGAAGLAQRAHALFTGEAPLAAIREAGRGLIERERGAVDRTVAFLEQWVGGAS